VLYRAAVVADGEHIEARHVDGAMPEQRSAHAVQMTPGEALELLERHKGNVSAAARAARVARSTFRAWVERERRRRLSD
jgi:transcriptional regulator of acetoin/glycerol metabolism